MDDNFVIAPIFQRQTILFLAVYLNMLITHQLFVIALDTIIYIFNIITYEPRVMMKGDNFRIFRNRVIKAGPDF